MITTESSKANALRMAKLLIQNKLAACVSIKQIFSIYKWDHDIEENKEFEITIKSKLEFKDYLIEFLNKNSNIAILEPSKNKRILEKKLCDFWEIDYVLCRESGSYSQKNWESIDSGSKMKLFLVKRPKVKNDFSYSFDQYHNLINHIINKY